MDRLTDKVFDCMSEFCDAKDCVCYEEEGCCSFERYRRLAAYEDTGLEPEEINILTDAIRESELVINHKLQAIHCKLDGKMVCVSADRLRELLRAEEEGRLVVLENIDDPLSLDGLSLFLQNRADAKGALNEYDKMLMREASYRLAEAAVAKNATTTGEKRTDA